MLDPQEGDAATGEGGAVGKPSPAKKAKGAKGAKQKGTQTKKRQAPTLLQKLLAGTQRVERAMLLQCFAHFEVKNFYSDDSSVGRVKEEGATEAEEGATEAHVA